MQCDDWPTDHMWFWGWKDPRLYVFRDPTNAGTSLRSLGSTRLWKFAFPIGIKSIQVPYGQNVIQTKHLCFGCCPCIGSSSCRRFLAVVVVVAFLQLLICCCCCCCRFCCRRCCILGGIIMFYNRLAQQENIPMGRFRAFSSRQISSRRAESFYPDYWWFMYNGRQSTLRPD